MKSILLFTASFLSLLIAFIGCDKEASLNTHINKEIYFFELSQSNIPPCLSHGGVGFQLVIKNNDDYEELRREYAIQGEYEYFEASGNQETYQLSYQPLDTNGDNILGPEDIIIYARSRPFRITYEGETYRVNSYPFYIYDDSLFINYEDDPHTTAGKIHFENVLNINPVTGTITFKEPLSVNTKVSISADKLYSSYEGKACSMNNFNFSKATIIGKKITGNGCLNGFKKQISIDHENKQIIYRWWKNEDKNSSRCPEIALSFTSWVKIKPPPPGYEIVFEEQL